MAHDQETENHDYSSPFEGPEKLLEIWFSPSPAHVPNGRGLRQVPRQIWEEMLDIVKCKVLSVIEGDEIDAYLLSESSLIISSHRLILKTCGTTLNLLGLPRILEIARDYAGLPRVHRCFYSRKSFMFPERQHGPHRGWSEEVSFLDAVFPGGSAYTIGKVNGDHWLLYLTGEDPGSSSTSEGRTAPSSPIIPLIDGPIHVNVGGTGSTPDYTIEILMSQLAPEARAPFFAPDDGSVLSPAEDAAKLSDEIGISDIFPRNMTTLDGYSFTPCGYSSNALINWGSGGLANGTGAAATATEAPTNGHVDSSEAEEQPTPAPAAATPSREGYYTIHVTPEEGWSYASFECNVPLSLSRSRSHQPNGAIPDLRTVVRRVVDIFRPGRITLTLFISSEDNRDFLEEDEDGVGESAVEAAQRAFKLALSGVPAASKKMNGATNGHHHGAWARYRRTDKINYEFGGYDLAFASFEVMQ